MSNDFGMKLKNTRLRMGLSLRDVSDKIGITDSRLSRLENGDDDSGDWKTAGDIGNLIKLLGLGPEFALAIMGFENPCSLLKENMKNKQNIPKTSFRLGELFCGPGGLAWGATHADIGDDDYRIVHEWANDYDEATCNTYRNNICPDDPESVVCEDVHTLDIPSLGAIDALAFGFPCNDFSVVGEQLGFKGKFGPLYSYGVKTLEIYKPKWFLAENVGGLTSANEG